MSATIEWVEADSADVDWTITPGEWSDAFASTNTGSAISFDSVIVEGSLEELKDFVARMANAVRDIEFALVAEAD